VADFTEICRSLESTQIYLYVTLVRDLHLNISYMHLCSISYDEVAQVNRQKGQVINSFTLAKIRARFGSDRIEKINAIVTSDLISKKIIDGKILLTDTTCLEKNI